MLKAKVILTRIVHRGIEAIKISFEKNDAITKQLGSLKDLKWSQTHKAWYAPYTETLRSDIFDRVCHLAFLDYSAMVKRNLSPVPKKEMTIAVPGMRRNLQVDTLEPLNAGSAEKIQVFKIWLKSRRYSESTIGTYTDSLRTFLRFYPNKAIHEISNEDLIHFNNEYILKNKLSASFQNQVVNAVKLFFRTVEMKSLNPELVHRPKRHNPLPNVLSKQEVELILKNTRNLKHRVALALIYSCGLRRSELLNLTLKDVNADRHLLIIKMAKGNKDRVAPLSQKIIEMLGEYYQVYRPKIYIFEGWVVGERYSEKSLQQVLKNSVKLAKIDKPVSLHWLRHSYATHLLEKGTDLRYIQEILGHKSSRTTEIYTHVSNKELSRIITPFDDLEL